MRRQERVVLRDQPHVLVAGGDQHPAAKVVTGDDIEDRGEAVLMVGAGPVEAARDIAREGRQRMIGEQPYRNAPAAEAARHADADMSAADDKGTGMGHGLHRLGNRKAEIAGLIRRPGALQRGAGDAPRGKAGTGDEAQ